VYADPAYFARAQEKRELRMRSEFQQWIMSQIDLSTPEARAYWEKHFPEYTEAAYEQIEKQKELELELDKIRIRGYHNEKDMWKKFLFDKKLIGSYDGKARANIPADWLLPEYESMYKEIGLNMRQEQGVMPDINGPPPVQHARDVPVGVQQVPQNPDTKVSRKSRVNFTQ